MIDTIQISHNLQEAGIPENQANAIAQSMLEIPDWANLATKSDLAELRAATKVDFAELRTEIQKVRTDLVYWVVGAAIAQFLASFLHR